MAQIHKGGLFQIHGLFKSMDWSKRELSLQLLYAMDHAYFVLILVHGLKNKPQI